MVDLTYFSYGVGLVLVGWLAGMMVGVVFNLARQPARG